MNLGAERKKELHIVNGKKKKGATTNKKRKKRAAKQAKKKTRRARRRSRNPGIDAGGLALATVSAGAAAVVAQPLAHLCNRIQNKAGRIAAKVLVPVAVGAAGGVGLSFLSPSAGKGFAAGAVAVGTLHGISAIANAGEAPGALHSMGYAMLGAPEDIIQRDGAVMRLLPDGSAQRLFPVTDGRSLVLTMDDNSQQAASLLGSIDEGHIIINSAGEMQLLPPGALGEVVEESGVGAVVEEDSGIGVVDGEDDDDDETGLGYPDDEEA